MLKSHPLSKLYPHLNFSGLSKEAPKRSESKEREEPRLPVEQPKPAERAPSVDKSHINVERPKRIPAKPAPKVTFKEPERAKTPEPELKIEIKEDPPAEIPEPDVVSETEQPPAEIAAETAAEPAKRTVIPRPNRLKPEAKPQPDRDNVLPTKGEKGLQRKYSQEQRKQMYLNRLSRKSIKTAEREVVEVNDILEKAGNTIEGLKEEEQRLKKGLKLVNYAKFFM